MLTVSGTLIAVDPSPRNCAPPAEHSVPGAYGLRLTGLDAGGLLARVRCDAPELAVRFSRGRVTDRAEQFMPDRAEICLIDDGWISLERSGHAELILPEPIPAEEMLHPWLVPAAATFNGWLGRQVLHGGVYARGGRAIAVLGDKEAGKSSLFAWLAGTDEFEILADDLVVVEAGSVFAGPRCIDLREGSVEALAPTSRRWLVRDASRFRVELPPCSDAAELVGIVILGWSSGVDVALHRLGPTDALTSLLPHALGGGERGLHGRLLDLLHLPTWVLQRQRDWGVMPLVEQQLRRLLA